MTRREINFPTRTPAPAIRCRSSQDWTSQEVRRRLGIAALDSVYAMLRSSDSASLESQASVEVSYTGCDSDTTLLPVVDGIRGENYPVDKQVLVSAKPPSKGLQFASPIGDVLVLANPSVPITTAIVPSSDVTITAT